MPAYRIYWLDRDNHVTEVDGLIAEAEDDVEKGRSRTSEGRLGRLRSPGNGARRRLPTMP
jgi:hypothetical protein